MNIRQILAVAAAAVASAGPAAVSLAQQPAPQASAPAGAPELARPPITVKCPNGEHYRLTTGSNAGACKLYFDRGRVVGGICTDGGNTASHTCSSGCKEITGSGACDKQDPLAAEGAAR